MILRDNPNIDFSKDILKAATKNHAYDGQSEGDRAHYVSSLINLAVKKEEIIKNILKALATEQEDTWALDQLFELAAIYAKKGNRKARQAIYKRYHKKVSYGSSWCGQEAIVKLDGIDGLKYIAETRGKALTENKDDWEDSFFVENFQEENPHIKVFDELRKASKENPYINKYLEEINENKVSNPQRSKRTKFSYQLVKESIERNKPFPVPPALIKDLKKTDIIKLADDFHKEADPIKQEKYLKVFARTKYPYDYHPIMQIAKRRNTRGTDLVEYACEALQYFQAKDIRQYAIHKLEKTNKPFVYLYLLFANYKNGDYKLLSQIADRYKNEHLVHELVGICIDLFKVNRTKECKKPLEIFYSKMTCGICRHEIIKILIDNEVLSRPILKEIEFDSYDETRNLFKKIVNDERKPT